MNNKTTYTKEWLKEISPNEPLVIAGPCSAETEEQVLNIAHQLKKNSKIKFYRAGIWKPRTRPGGFEGIGEMGLKWLDKVKKETGLKTATEVANRNHVRLALENDVDLLWIGALERLQRANIKNIGVIHRGFSTYEKTKYRNIPEWQIVIDLQNRFPELPIICDPSHIAGNRELIAELSQTALNLNFNGLMIESHCNPDVAWSDSTQQITPETLSKILTNLIIRHQNTSENEFQSQLDSFRLQIDLLDSQLLEILKKRMNIAENIGSIKKEKNIAVLQNKRWNDILENMIHKGSLHGLSEEFISKIFKAIHQESIHRQEKVYNKN